MSKRIIGLVGFKGSGKDTVGEILSAKYGYTTTSFATGLKAALCAMFGWQPHMLEGKSHESRAWREQEDLWWSVRLGQVFTPRSMLQHFGTGIVRHHLHNRFWVYRTQLEMQTIPGDIVITDGRFADELNMIREQGGVIVHVQRGQLPVWWNKARWVNKLPPWLKTRVIKFIPSLREVHESERNWIGEHVDFLIVNNGSLAELEAKVDVLVQKIAQV